MNITAFEYEDTIVVVDCGLAFPTDDMLGIDLVIRMSPIWSAISTRSRAS